jgi:uncharacterized membrane protein YdbT with pleckstrin-like domain
MNLICDKCDKPFRADGARAGQKIQCPSCGDVKVVPGEAGVTVTAAADRATAMGLPPATGPETTVLVARGAMFRSSPFSFTALALLIVAGLVGAAGLVFSGQLWLAVGCIVVGAAGMLALGVWKVANLAERLEVTNKRVIFTKGLLSKASIEMLHRTIQDIEIKQTLANRVFNVGTIAIANASDEDDAVVIHDVPKPYRIREVIDAYRPM